jgi:hypothetical protein
MLGQEVAEKVREVRPDIEVLYMSGYAERVLAARGRLDADVNLIEKPFSASAIIERAGQLLNDHFREPAPDRTDRDPAAPFLDDRHNLDGEG